MNHYISSFMWTTIEKTIKAVRKWIDEEEKKKSWCSRETYNEIVIYYTLYIMSEYDSEHVFPTQFILSRHAILI